MPRSKFRDKKNSKFSILFEILLRQIEKDLGEPYNPDGMLAEGQALFSEFYSSRWDLIGYEMNKLTGLDNAEDRAFEDLTASMSKAKKFVDYFAGKEYFATLDIPTRMPRSRAKVREAARAVLSAWDEHSADPELAAVTSAMDALRDAYEAWVAAWDAQQDANRIKKEKTRAAQEARAKCEKFVSRVKKYLSLYLDPDDSKWGLYGFERRGKND